MVVVTDTTNNNYEMFECVICNSSSNQTITEYGNIDTDSTLGSIGITSVGSNINLTYTPIAGADIEVRTFGIDLKIFDNLVTP